MFRPYKVHHQANNGVSQGTGVVVPVGGNSNTCTLTNTIVYIA